MRTWTHRNEVFLSPLLSAFFKYHNQLNGEPNETLCLLPCLTPILNRNRGDSVQYSQTFMYSIKKEKEHSYTTGGGGEGGGRQSYRYN
jgi:hypothetical protein